MADGTLKFDTSIDESGFNKEIKKVEQSAKKTAKNVGSSAKDAGEDAEKAADDVSKKTQKVSESVEQKIKKSAKASKDSAKDAGKSIGSGAEQAGEKIRKSSKKTSDVVEKSIESTADVAEKGFSAIKAAAVSAAAASGATFVAAGVATIKNAMEMTTAANQLAAATGDGAEELLQYRDVLEGVYKNNYGESFEDVGNAITVITQQIKGLNDSGLQETTESAIALRDVFGYEVNESVRASKAMMDQFGISSEKAMNLIANGSQDGLDYSGELLDSISEYSVQFAKVGLSADDMFAIFKSGADSGAWNLDKIGDAVKEFSIRAIDGSDTTVQGFEKLGMNADEMAQKFASGGDLAREAFKQVIQGLAEMDDPVEQSIAGVDLFGTMWEDLGPDVVEQLANITDGAYGAGDALDKIKEVRYDDVASSLATLGRTVTTKFIDPLADKALPLVKKVIDGVTDSLDPPKTMLEDFNSEISETVKNIGSSVKQARNLLDSATGDTPELTSELEYYKSIILELNGVENKSEWQKYQLKTAVDAVSGSIPELAEAFNEETGSLSLTNQEISDYIDNHEKVILQQAAVEAQTEAYKALFDAKLEQAKADSAVEAAQNKLNEAVAKNNLTMDDYATGGGQYIDEVVEAQEALRVAEENQRKLNGTTAEAQEVYDQAQDAISRTAEELGNGLPQSAEEAENSLSGTVESAKKMGVGISKALANSISSGSMEAKTAASMLGDSISGSFDQITQSAKDAGVEISPEIAAGLQAGGQEAVDAFQVLANQISAAGEQAGQDSGQNLTEETAQSIETGASEVVDAASDVGTEAGTQMQESESSAIEQNSGKVTGAVSSTMQSAVSTADGYKSSFDGIGYSMAEGVAAGFNRGSPVIKNAVDAVLQSAVDEGTKKIKKNSPSHVWRDEIGESMAEGVAVGIRNGTGNIEDSVVDMADASLNAAKDELEINSPSGVFKKKIGKNIVKGVIKGIQDDQKLLNKEMKSMCSQALEAAKSVDAKTGNYSDVGSAIIESIAAGLDSRKDLTSRKLEKKINGYVDKAVGDLEKKADNTKSKKKKKKYQKDAEALKEFADEYVASFLNALNAGIDAEYDRIQAKLGDKLTEISDRYQELYDTITSKQAGMMGKMSIPSNLYDLDTQLEQIERYQSGLNRLKGKIPDTLMDEIIGMDVNEADNFVEYLNSLTDSELAAYKEKWGSLQSQSKSFSESFFSSQLGSLKAEYQKEIEDATKDVQAQMKSVGKNIATGLIKGLESEKEVLDKACRKIANGMIKQFKDTFKIKSPSKVMETQVGRYLPPGIADGFEEAMPAAEHRITDGVLRAIDDLQCCIDGMQYRPAVLTGGYGITPHVNITNSQPVQVQAEIHTSVDLDGRVVGRAVTPYVNQNLGEYQSRERRGS